MISDNDDEILHSFSTIVHDDDKFLNKIMSNIDVLRITYNTKELTNFKFLFAKSSNTAINLCISCLDLNQTLYQSKPVE